MLELLTTPLVPQDAGNDYLPAIATDNLTALIVQVTGLPASWSIAGYAYQQINLTSESQYDTWVVVEQFVIQANRAVLVAPKELRYPWRLLFRWVRYLKPATLQIWGSEYEMEQPVVTPPTPPAPSVFTLEASSAPNRGDGWTNPNNPQRPNALQQGWFAWQYLGWPWNEPTGQYKIEMECNPIRLDATVTTGTVDLAVSPLIQFHWPEVADDGNIGNTWQTVVLAENHTITNGQTLRFGVSRNNPIPPVLSKLIITKL